MDGIENYAFYGEAGDRHTGEILHCETLRARSVLHDWRFRPHRHHGMHQFFWIGSGAGMATIDGEERPIGPWTAISLPAMTVHGFVFQPGIEGWVITIPTANLGGVLAMSDIVRARLQRPVLFTAGSSAEALFAQIAAEFGRFSPERELALTALAGLLAVWFAREIAGLPNLAPGAADRGRELVMRFLRRIEEDLTRHLPVAAHAAAMGVTPTHLSRLCRQIAGRPASALIYDRLTLEGRRQLVYTAKTVAEIAYDLGFQDPAHFTKFFRRQTGQSPSQYRAAIGHAGSWGHRGFRAG